MTREQQAARKAISLIEGNLAGQMDGTHHLVLETFDGRVYRVDPDASRIQRIEPDGTVRITDLVQLEGEANPMWADEGETVCDFGFDLPVGESISDLDWERMQELRAEAKRIEDDKNYYRERGEAA